MKTPLVHEMKSVVLTTSNTQRLAEFYSRVFGLPLEEERHRGVGRHCAAQLGGIHFAIHDRESFWLEPARERPDTVVSFTVADLDGLRAHAQSLGVEVLAETRIGPMAFVGMTDPDGRSIGCGTPWPGRKR